MFPNRDDNCVFKVVTSSVTTNATEAGSLASLSEVNKCFSIVIIRKVIVKRKLRFAVHQQVLQVLAQSLHHPPGSNPEQFFCTCTSKWCTYMARKHGGQCHLRHRGD